MNTVVQAKIIMQHQSEQGSKENVTSQTKSGRAVRPPPLRLIEEIRAIHLTKAERKYYKIDNQYQNY